jgi:hypothetical protein
MQGCQNKPWEDSEVTTHNIAAIYAKNKSQTLFWVSTAWDTKSSIVHATVTTSFPYGNNKTSTKHTVY